MGFSCHCLVNLHMVRRTVPRSTPWHARGGRSPLILSALRRPTKKKKKRHNTGSTGKTLVLFQIPVHRSLHFVDRAAPRRHKQQGERRAGMGGTGSVRKKLDTKKQRQRATKRRVWTRPAPTSPGGNRNNQPGARQ